MKKKIDLGFVFHELIDIYTNFARVFLSMFIGVFIAYIVLQIKVDAENAIAMSIVVSLLFAIGEYLFDKIPSAHSHTPDGCFTVYGLSKKLDRQFDVRQPTNIFSVKEELLLKDEKKRKSKRTVYLDNVPF